MKEKRAYYKRQFLNSEEHGGQAAIEAKVTELNGKSLEASVSISDCDRTIHLDFGCWGDGDAENHRLKLKRLITTLKAFETAFLAELERMPNETAKRTR